MNYQYQVILKNSIVVDPTNNRFDVLDIGIQGGKIIDIAPNLKASQAEESFDLRGYYTIPGIVDLHVHASSWLGGQYGHKMMAKAGVTTALDMSGPIESVLDIAVSHGVGLNLACIQYVRPGHTVDSDDPNRSVLEKMIKFSLEKGAYGIKLLGGHYPLSPESTANAIEIAHQQKAYCAFHAGTLNKKSDLEGLYEAVELIDRYPVHLAHINSYCRGKIKPAMVEAEEAIELLIKNPHICSESYLSPVNGTSGKCSDGAPESQVTVMCLGTGGFEATQKGLEEAIMKGWAQVNVESGGEMILATGKTAAEWWLAKGTDTTLSFPVNPQIPRLRLATAKRENNQFVVDCISTDGGGIPRNVTVEAGLSLVKLQALTMEEFVIKTSRNPAKILGLKNKGHLSIEADADITVVDLNTQKPIMTMSNGQVIMWKGKICGSGTHIITTPAGASFVESKGLIPQVVDPEETPFYQRKS
jgi:hypothetical protein